MCLSCLDEVGPVVFTLPWSRRSEVNYVNGNYFIPTRPFDRPPAVCWTLTLECTVNERGVWVHSHTKPSGSQYHKQDLRQIQPCNRFDLDNNAVQNTQVAKVAFD